MPVHLRAEPSDYADAVLVPGDPKRARYIAETFFDPGARCVNDERGMLGFTGSFNGSPLSVQSVGMGGPSAAIYYSELIQLGAKRLVRVGTAGGLRKGLRMGDTLIAVSATPDDPTVGTLTQGEPHAPTATYSLIELSAQLARAQGATVYVGPVVTSGLFYDPRPGIMQRWRERGHLGVEMEVEEGETVLITKNGRTVAELRPRAPDRRDDPEWRAAYDEMIELMRSTAATGYRVGKITEEDKYGDAPL